MESHRDDAASTLRELARAEAAPWTDYPRTPWWYAPAAGLVPTGFLVTGAAFSDQPASRLACVAALCLGIGVFVGWYRRYRGTMPALRSMPGAFRLPAAVLVVTLAAIAGLVLLISATWVAAIVTWVSTTATFAWYERAYARAARRTLTDLESPA